MAGREVRCIHAGLDALPPLHPEADVPPTDVPVREGRECTEAPYSTLLEVSGLTVHFPIRRGLLKRVVDAGDPYARQCEASAAAIAEALGLAPGEIQLAYQSRFGKGKWLQPDVVAVLRQLAGEGVRTVDVACPGFAVDCLETLEEIAMQAAALFRDAGGEALRYIPCLNADAAHADALAALAQAHEGWR